MAINVHEVRGREEVRGQLGLFVHNVMVVVPHQRSVVRVEELLSGMLGTDTYKHSHTTR